MIPGLYHKPPAPLAALSGQQPIAYILIADLTSTADQAFTFRRSPPRWAIRRIVAVRRTGAFSVACLGGIYTGASKSGSAVVSAAQSWAPLTGAGKFLDLTLAAIAGTDILSGAGLFLSLTTGNAAALEADIYVFGDLL